MWTFPHGNNFGIGVLAHKTVSQKIIKNNKKSTHPHDKQMQEEMLSGTGTLKYVSGRKETKYLSGSSIPRELNKFRPQHPLPHYDTFRGERRSIAGLLRFSIIKQELPTIGVQK